MRKVILLLSFIFIVSSLCAKNKFIIKVNADAFKGSADGIRIEIYCNSQKQTSLKVSKSGKCDVQLLFNKDYRLAFVKNGYVTKYVDINTDVPEDILDYDNHFPPEKLNIILLPSRENVDISVFKQPVEKLYYDKDIDDFVFDKDYASLIKDRIEETEKLLMKKEKTTAKLPEPDLASKEVKNTDDSLAENIEVKTEKNNQQKKAQEKAVPPKKADKTKAVSVVGMIGGMRVVADVGEGDDNSTELPGSIKNNDSPLIKTDTLSVKSDSVNKTVDMLAKVDNILKTNPIQSSGDALPNNDEAKIPFSPEKEKTDLLNELHKKLNERDKSKLNNDYNILISKGDTAFNIGNYAIARFYYTQAKSLKSYEPYPGKKLEEIISILKDSKYQKSQKQYSEIVNKADGSFEKNLYVVARYFYKRAHEIRSWDEHVKKRLKEIERKIGK